MDAGFTHQWRLILVKPAPSAFGRLWLPETLSFEQKSTSFWNFILAVVPGFGATQMRPMLISILIALLEWRQLYCPWIIFPSSQDISHPSDALYHRALRPITTLRCHQNFSLILLIWACDKPFSCLFQWHHNKPPYICNITHGWPFISR